MPRYTVENNDGKRVTFEWDSQTPPTDLDLEEVFASIPQLPTKTKESAGMAETAVGLVTPRQTEAAQINNPAQLVKRVWDATKETFVPTKESFNRFLKPVAGQAGLSALAEQAGGVVSGAVKRSGQNIADKLVESDFAKPTPLTAAGIGAAVSTFSDLTADSLKPSALQQSLGAEQLGVLAKGGTAAIRNKVADVSGGVAKDAGRRALGFIKSEIKKLRRVGGVERANAVASEMLDSGVISPMSSPETMLERAQKLASDKMNEVGTIISKLEKSSPGSKIGADALSKRIEEELGRTLGKGATSAEKGLISEVLERVKGYTDETGTISFFDAQDLKRTLQGFGNFKGAPDQTALTKASLYRRASGIVNAQLRKSIGAASKEITGGEELLKQYLAANSTQGKALDAIGPLQQFVEKGGNKFFDPLTTAGAIGGGVAGVTFGNAGEATALTGAAILGKKFADSYGAQLTATGLNNLSRLMRVGKVPESALTNPIAVKEFVAILNRMALPKAISAKQEKDKQ